MDWDIAVGETRKRRDVHRVYGGQQQQGISTPARSPNILLFTDPDKGRKYGYDAFEGLRDDGIYSYTGEGRAGPQEMTRGNLAILNSPATGKALRLFRTRGTSATYIGEFVLGDPPYTEQQIQDEKHNPRRGFIFNLAPVEWASDQLPTYGGGALAQADVIPWTPPAYDPVSMPASFLEARVGSRIEFELQSYFGSWRERRGSILKRLRIPVNGSVIVPDFYDETLGEVIEAKKSPARGYVRTAIGQVLDYCNNARQAGYSASPAVLLPGRPDADLIDLCKSLGIALYVREMNAFIELTGKR
ncbi:hypothetical protein NY547_00035 [Cnuibacter physcomitrellae]|uniref:hypothetical protein n=1 Tax=Cnuibacter physcomitrellae TaxID=1619308 RepID=UPI002175A4D4|nr:hypothetical protein [Cnuibacter physcomitrellae]MCS5495625.1 hypothetical protein [Cnuibacter physcomitrellae]